MNRIITSILMTAVLLVTTIFSMTGCGGKDMESINMDKEAELQSTSVSTAMSFSDVSKADWFYEYVSYAYENELMNGVSATQFNPNGSLTRGMFVTILGRFDGIDESDYEGTSFSDEAAGQWYTPYVEWAYENDITQGMGNGQFGVNSPVTREQMATFIARYVESGGIELAEAENPIAYFKDASSVDSWAKKGLELMRKSGILAGDSNGNFRPLASATRAEAAAVFMRLDKAINGSGEDPDEGEKTEADIYFEETGKVISKTPVEESEFAMTETKAFSVKNERGFKLDMLTEYDMLGNQLSEDRVISGFSTDKHPSYYTNYVSATGEQWTIFINEDRFLAYPVTYNMNSGSEKVTVISEKKSIINYDVLDNVYYEVIPDGTETVVKVVSSINASTLDKLTKEEIDRL